MIFPGMDPYLEAPALWPGVHGRLVVYTADALEPLLAPRYTAAVEERVYREGSGRPVSPDVSVRELRPERATRRPSSSAVAFDAPVIVWTPPEVVRETFIAVRDLHAGQRVVTVIEVVSPANKYAGPGRESYQAKQSEVLASDVHLVEVDLLRGGPHVVAVSEAAARQRGPYDYLTCVNRGGDRYAFELYPRVLRDRLPRVAVPLADDDPDVPLDLQAVVSRAYDAGSYRRRIDYSRPCDPPLGPDDRAWAEALIRDSAGGGPG
jgi:hypothetical protein